MTRRLELAWNETAPFEGRAGRPIRILAASDEDDPTLDHPANREALGPIDLVVCCGDLSPDRVAFLGDAFRTSLVYVRGNHDHGRPWATTKVVPIESKGLDRRSLPGATLLALPWPTLDGDPARRDEGAAWRQVAGALGARLLVSGGPAWLVFSHAPPRGAGDSPEDLYHAGFGAYRTVLDRLRPRLWLHGHTSRAAARDPIVEHGPTTLVNVTGSFVVELRPG